MLCALCGEPHGPEGRYCARCGAPARRSGRVRAFVALTWVLVAVLGLGTLLVHGMLSSGPGTAGLVLFPLLLIQIVVGPILVVGALAMRGRWSWAYRLCVGAGLAAGAAWILFLPIALLVFPFHLAHWLLARHADVRRWYARSKNPATPGHDG